VGEEKEEDDESVHGRGRGREGGLLELERIEEFGGGREGGEESACEMAALVENEGCQAGLWSISSHTPPARPPVTNSRTLDIFIRLDFMPICSA